MQNKTRPKPTCRAARLASLVIVQFAYEWIRLVPKLCDLPARQVTASFTWTGDVLTHMQVWSGMRWVRAERARTTMSASTPGTKTQSLGISGIILELKQPQMDRSSTRRIGVAPLSYLLRREYRITFPTDDSS